MGLKVWILAIIGVVMILGGIGFSGTFHWGTTAFWILLGLIFLFKAWRSVE